MVIMDFSELETNIIFNIKMLVLTKSVKYGGLCVSGIDLSSKQLIRLVANKEGAEISKSDFTFNGQPVNVLDVIAVRCIYSPLLIQKENYILKTIFGKRVIPATILELEKVMKTIKNGNLLYTNFCSIKEKDTRTLYGSLMIVEVTNLKLYTTQNNQGKSKTKADFSYKKQSYISFAVTDSDFFNKTMTIEHCKIVLSIPEKPYNGYHYKFIAKIFPT